MPCLHLPCFYLHCPLYIYSALIFSELDSTFMYVLFIEIKTFGHDTGIYYIAYATFIRGPKSFASYSLDNRDTCGIAFSTLLLFYPSIYLSFCCYSQRPYNKISCLNVQKFALHMFLPDLYICLITAGWVIINGAI